MSTFNLIIKPDEDDIEAAEIYVDGIIDGKNYRFIFDTGAARTSVQFDNYTSNFESTGKNTSSGVFAKISDDLIIVPYIELGSISKKKFTLTRFSENSPNTRNLIGMDLLKDFCFQFNFDENKISIENSNHFENIEDFQELILDMKFHPYIYVEYGKLKVKAVWDTGAGITIADINFIKKHPSFFQEIGKSIGTDSTGVKMETPMFTMISPTIGNYVFPPHKVAGVDLFHINSTTNVPMDLILGYNTLSKANWLFDFPNKRWAIIKMLRNPNLI